MANQFELHCIGPELPAEGKTFLLPPGTTLIGRHFTNDLVLSDDKRVSGRHAKIDCTQAGCHLTDLESTNGTTVNGEGLKPDTPRLLSDGDVIKIGGYTLTYGQTAIENPVADPPVADREPASPVPQPLPAYRPLRTDTLTDLPAIPPGLSLFSYRLINYLPGAYRPHFKEADELRQPTGVSFTARFLGIFESIITPIEWTVDNFDLFLHAQTTPAEFLPWLAGWFDGVFDLTWSEAQRRQFLTEAHKIYARRGTRWALCRTLEIYTGATPDIEEPEDEPHTFHVILRLPRERVDEQTKPAIERIIDRSKPAHTSYKVRFV